MTEAEKIETLRAMLGDEVTDMTDATLSVFLSKAEQFVLNTLYPYEDVSEKEIPARYAFKPIELAVYDIGKIGVEGQTQHIENGTHRNYESASYPDSMISDLVPFVGGVGL